MLWIISTPKEVTTCRLRTTELDDENFILIQIWEKQKPFRLVENSFCQHPWAFAGGSTVYMFHLGRNIL